MAFIASLTSKKSFEKIFPNAFQALKQANREEIFPSAQVAVYLNKRIYHYELNCDQSTLFDLASLSKIVGTTTLAGIAMTQNRIKLSQPLSDYFPEYSTKNTGFLDEPIILDLLLHKAGFPAWIDLHSEFHDSLTSLSYCEIINTIKESSRKKIFQSWYDTKAFSDSKRVNIVYSDLGFILLGWILESVFNMPIDEAFQEFVSLPLGIENLQYQPVDPNIAPTEQCPWRKRLLRGEVHDDNCFALGGGAGHAGLFGSALHLMTWSQQWLSALSGENHTNDDGFNPLTWDLSSQTARYFWDTTAQDAQNPGVTRALGWDIPAKEASSAGRLLQNAPAARGHLGFTGTSLWIDPEQQFIVILLTNRVCPTRHHEKMKTFRPIFHNELLKDLSNL